MRKVGVHVGLALQDLQQLMAHRPFAALVDCKGAAPGEHSARARACIVLAVFAAVVLVLGRRGEQAKAKLLTWTRAWLAPLLRLLPKVDVVQVVGAVVPAHRLAKHSADSNHSYVVLDPEAFAHLQPQVKGFHAAGRVTLDVGLVLDRQQGRWPG